MRASLVARRALGWRTALALVCTLAALQVRLPRDTRLMARFPRVPPRRLGHFLADFTNYPRLYPHFGAWRVEDEATDNGSWRYAVAYECGARCSGRAEIDARDEPTKGEHRTRLRDVACTSPPGLAWLPWARSCEELEVESVIRAAARGGSELQETARVWCGALRLATGGCAVGGLRERHLAALRDAIAGD